MGQGEAGRGTEKEGPKLNLGHELAAEPGSLWAQ